MISILFCGSDNPFSIKALKILVERGLFVSYYLVSEDQSCETVNYCAENTIKIIRDFPSDREKFDWIISFSFKRRIPIDLVKRSSFAINFHPAPLPYYRGRGTTSQVLLNNGDKWGVTCHYIDEKFDTGRIVERKWFKITDDLEVGWKLSNYSWKVCLTLLNDVIDKVVRGEFIESFDQESDGSYYSMKMLQNSKKISIEDSVSSINKKINALWYPPYEGAYIEKDGEKFYLINKKIFSEIMELYKNCKG